MQSDDAGVEESGVCKETVEGHIKWRVTCRTEGKKISGESAYQHSIITQTVRSINCDDKIDNVFGGGKIGIRCPECIVNDLSSRVTLGCGMRTSIGVSSYYENGKKHEHDKNVSRAEWTCSQGHAGTYRSVICCPAVDCDYVGYTILTTDPYEFSAAKKERQRVWDEEYKRNAEADRIAGGGAQRPPHDCSIGNYTNYLFTTAPVSSVLNIVPSIAVTPGNANSVQPDVMSVRITYGNRTYVGDITAIPEDAKK